MNNYIVVPPKFIKEFLELYHLLNENKGYHQITFDILNDGYYIKGLYIKIKDIINNCFICSQNKKNIFKKPSIVLIILKGLNLNIK